MNSFSISDGFYTPQLDLALGQYKGLCGLSQSTDCDR